ncbi:hypothetical protein ACH95_08175 [Bacillus glycinifermentans]|uniref:Uncharacterized protein n=1 Tax=Bacillus glycinifermentans TaxID=1664069 RepID=A0A0J6EK57_9BACI|nr:hypothetical protein COP00_15655 [Bacillus glycinifermentans]KMM60886.1 hypothetical protein ACH95_08175 [Bacillus glycinifermentans]KRT89936.1 hypothetical protein AB447_204900 [Bacillus glycinifermentans]
MQFSAKADWDKTTKLNECIILQKQKMIWLLFMPFFANMHYPLKQRLWQGTKSISFLNRMHTMKKVKLKRKPKNEFYRRIKCRSAKKRGIPSLFLRNYGTLQSL